MSFYTGLRSTAAKLIKDFGVTGALKRDVASAFDPVVGEDSGATVQSISVSAVITSLSKSYDKTDAVVKASSNVALISGVDPTTGVAIAFDPVAGDNLTLLSVDWKINSVELIQPGGTVVIYKALVSK
jgi:hypothetical protein